MIYDAAELARAVALIHQDGFFTDEDVFGSYPVDQDSENLIEQLKSSGFDGDELKRRGSAPNGSAVYWIFDPARMTEEEAQQAAEARHEALEANYP